MKINWQSIEKKYRRKNRSPTRYTLEKTARARGYKWIPRVTDVRQCPMCRSPFWDVPKSEENKEEVDC